MKIRNWTEEEFKFIKEYAPTHTWKETTEEHNKRFKERTLNNIKTVANRYKIYAKGPLDGKPCWNYKPLGHECKTSNGYIRVKTEKGYIIKSRVINPTTKKQCVLLDGNKENYSPENLYFIDRKALAEYMILARWNLGFNSKNPEIKKVALKISETIVTLKENSDEDINGSI